MTYDPEIHHRRSIRLKGHDYSWAGAYFVTICTQDKRHLFGRVADGEMRLNEAGQIIHHTWMNLPGRFPTIKVDAFVVMPNHVHGIIVVGAPLVGAHPVDADLVAAQPADADIAAQNPNSRREPDEAVAGTSDLCGTRAPTRGAPTGLGHVVGAFKSLSTNAYSHGVRQCGWPPFPGRLWQRNYYEHIIRSEEEFYSIRSYIDANPIRWDMARENPLAVVKDRAERWEA